MMKFISILSTVTLLCSFKWAVEDGCLTNVIITFISTAGLIWSVAMMVDDHDI